MQLSDLNFTGQTAEEALSRSYKDIKIDRYRNRLTAKFSLYSLSRFTGSLAVCLFWNGIVSVFVSIALAGLYYNFVGPIPEWFPALGLEDGTPIMNDEAMGVGMTLFLCAFLTPFLVVGAGLFVNTMLRLVGTSEIVLDRRGSYVSTGVGVFRLKRSFDASQVVSINQKLSWMNNEGESNQIIEIIADRTVKFGLFLHEHQKEWATFFMKALLVQKRDVGRIERLQWL